MTFWERFYSLCIERNTKPNPVAAKLRIPSGTVSGWKNGSNPNVSHIEKLSDYFGVSIDYLLGKSDTKKEQAALMELPAADELEKLYIMISTLSEEETQKVREYVEFLIYQRANLID